MEMEVEDAVSRESQVVPSRASSSDALWSYWHCVYVAASYSVDAVPETEAEESPTPQTPDAGADPDSAAVPAPRRLGTVQAPRRATRADGRGTPSQHMEEHNTSLLRDLPRVPPSRVALQRRPLPTLAQSERSTMYTPSLSKDRSCSIFISTSQTPYLFSVTLGL